MKILVYEFFSGGLTLGSGYEEMEKAAPVEGMAMLRAALTDFSKVKDVFAFTVASSHAARKLEKYSKDFEIRKTGKNPRKAFERAVEDCDAALIIAPETGGALVELNDFVAYKTKKLLGCGREAVSVTADKLAFANIMEEAGLPHPENIWLGRACGALPDDVVIKPISGAGAFKVSKIPSGGKIGSLKTGFMAQRYIHGESMSLCIVSGKAGAEILSVNRQFLTDDFEYEEGEILDMQPGAVLADIVRKLRKAVPGLEGYWGMDFVQTENGPVVIEVNPRLTTSYCALSSAMDINPADAILSAVLGEPIPVGNVIKAMRFNTAGELWQA